MSIAKKNYEQRSDAVVVDHKHSHASHPSQGLPESRSPSENLRGRRRKELEAFLVSIKQDQVADMVFDDVELFSTIVDMATSDYGIEQKTIASYLGVNPTAVGRWKSREHAPRAYARRSVIVTIVSLLEAKLQASANDSEHSQDAAAKKADPIF